MNAWEIPFTLSMHSCINFLKFQKILKEYDSADNK